MKKIKLYANIIIYSLLTVSLILGIHLITLKAAPIKIVSARYGTNCPKTLNITKDLQQLCDGKTECTYIVDAKDPSPGCSKDFVVKWSCKEPSPVYPVYSSTTEKEALGKTALIKCN